MKEQDEYILLEERGDRTLLRSVSYGDIEAFDVLVKRYLSQVYRTSFRILCDRVDAESVTLKVFESLWHDVLEYDERFTLSEWLLRKTCLYGRLRIMRRRLLRAIGVTNDVFVNASPKVEKQDDFLTKQAWELYCRATMHMTPLQIISYAMTILEEIDAVDVSRILGLTHFRIGLASRRAVGKVRKELAHYRKENEYGRYVGFLKKVAEEQMDMGRMENRIMEQTGANL